MKKQEKKSKSFKKFRKIDIRIKASEQEKEYFRALTNWEKNSKNTELVVGPLHC